MGIIATRRRLWGSPRLGKRSPTEGTGVRGRFITRRLRLFLEMGIGVLVVIWLLCVAWVELVS